MRTTSQRQLRHKAEILLRKSSTSHKSFTFTPFISASEKFLMRHASFSKLKNVPKIYDKRCIVDVNKTAMWKMDVLNKSVRDFVKKCRGLFDTKSNVLIILDSYVAHTKFVRKNEDQFLVKGIFCFAYQFAPVSGRVGQLIISTIFYDCIDAYQSESLAYDINRTAKGNVKKPSVEHVIKWAVDWAETKTETKLCMSFDVCGLVPQNDFKIELLHPPLREIYNNNFESDD